MWYMNEDREMLVSVFREFAEQEIAPAVKRMEENEEYPREAIRKLGELGMLGLTIDEEYGGAGRDYINHGLMIEEFAKVSHGFALLAYLASELTLAYITKIGTPEQIAKYLPEGLSGEKLFAICLTEPCGIYNPVEHETTAVLDGDEWVINGGKILITNAGEADVYLLLCRTSDKFDPATTRGMSIIAVPADAEGVKVGHIENKLGWKGSHTGQMYFDNVRVPKDNLIGEQDGAWAAMNVALGPMFADYGPMNLGSMEAVYDKTVDFLKNRIQDGVSLWDSHEVIRSEMARLWAKISNYRGAVYSALQDENEGKDISSEAIALKLEGADLLELVTSQCIEFQGGMGTVYETGIERYYRDAKMGALGCGSNRTLINFMSAKL